MPSSYPINPQGALRTYTDFTTWVDADGIFRGEDWYQDVLPYRASTAVSAGDALMLVAPTTTTPMSVTPLSTTAGQAFRFAGVAKKAAAAGQNVDVVVKGVCLYNTGGAAPAFGDVLTAPATGTAGVLTLTAQASVAATQLIGTLAGTALSANNVGGTNKAVMWVERG